MTFEIQKAKLERVPLLVSLIGMSGSGKTYSALELAKGMSRVYEGRTVLIDTDNRRGLHYANLFDYDHVEFPAPHSPARYVECIEAVMATNPGCVIIDNMSHEHTGTGGILEMHDAEVERRFQQSKSQSATRNSFNAVAWGAVKAERAKLNRAITRAAVNCPFILIYQGKHKVDLPTSGGQAKEVGWIPDTTSGAIWDTTIQFLLMPCSDGVPTLTSQLAEEAKHIKRPAQFRDILMPGQRLAPEVGEQMARWAYGDGAVRELPPEPAPTAPPMTEEEERAMVELQEARDGVLALKARKAVKGAEMVKYIRQLFPGERTFDSLNLDELKRLNKELEDR
jgi:hypothetical protein